jgi:hypothetical protein
MPHKRVSPDALKQAQNSIEFCNSALGMIRSVKQGGTDGLKSGLELIRELEFDSGVQKDTQLKLGTEEGARKALRALGMQEAYQQVLMVFEAPGDVSARYEQELVFWTKRLDQLKSFGQAQSGDLPEG